MGEHPGRNSVEQASDVVEIEGVVERIVYESPDTGFFVARMREADNPNLTTFVGNLMAVSPGETIRIRGRWVDDKKFGRQIRTESYETILPNSVDGIEKYLGSGLIPGIGPAYAKRMIDKFGVDTLRIIDEEPRRLRQVEGIGKKRAEQIRVAWAEQKSIRSIMIFLQGHGIGTSQSVRIYKRYGDGAVAVLRENPYQLAEDISGIGFTGADKIATSLGIAPDSPRRLEAGLHYTLQRAVTEGHTFLGREDLMERARELLGCEVQALETALESIVTKKAIVQEQDAYYLENLYAAERGAEHHLKRLLQASKTEIELDIESAIRSVEKEQRIQLSAEQADALRMAAQARVLVITGGPGTGKTTLINCLLAIFEQQGLQTLLAAPTGRAAKRMEAATRREAKTIHRLLEFSPREGGFRRDAMNPLNTDLLVIDETSMVDVSLMDSLLQAIPEHARVVFVGDVDQLPSVGPGNVLVDMIASGVIPCARLETIFRQAAQSGIVRNAHRINRGEKPEGDTDDFFFIERKDPAAALATIVEVVKNRIPGKFGLDPMRDIQVLAPMHRGDCGVANLNLQLQEALNPGGTPIDRKNFRLGDKVIQQRNNYDLDVFNGDLGTITLVDVETKELHVAFEDRVVLYGFDELDDLTLAYAVTVHKSQGSEYPAIVMPLVTQHYMMLQRNVLYTAITRARRLVILVGDPKAMALALANTRVTRRNTRLSERLRNEL
ncbi:MAG: ATP-dependent RecD-like DNA helicase [Candidatus Hydrogenedentes bacterium]|nr:ATP-dependent RecD-like DNA helicase [Candidatus Hydrogenedentota bacterium]